MWFGSWSSFEGLFLGVALILTGWLVYRLNRHIHLPFLINIIVAAAIVFFLYVFLRLMFVFSIVMLAVMAVVAAIQLANFLRGVFKKEAGR